MAKQILFNEEARAALKKGIDKLSNAVRMTLGPKGRAAVIDRGYGAPQVTFDGVTVAKEIELADKYENLGADFIKQAAEKTNDNVGDGTTTSVVLAHEMITAGEELIRKEGFNVIQLAEELKKASKEVIDGLERQKEDINDHKKIEEVAILAAKDSEMGELIAEVMSKIGKDGVVTVEDSNTTNNSYEIVEGMRFDRGYVSHYMVTNSEKMEAAYEDVRMLITDRKISSIQDILPLLEKVAESGKKELVIIAEEVDGEALTTLVVNKLRGTFNTVAIKAPGYGDRRKEMLGDIAVITGGQVISEDFGIKMEKAELSMLGSAHRVVVDKDNTTIVGGKGDKKNIDERISQLKNQIQHTDSKFDKEKLQERLGKLSGGVAIIKVGAPTESAQKAFKDRVDDAVAATKAAMEEGIVPGGGIALFNLELDRRSKPKKHEMPVVYAALAIMERALKAPLAAIIANSGESAESIMEKLMEKKEADPKKEIWTGFNAQTNEIGNLKELGIIDPLKVTKTAFLNAVSVASNYLTVGVAITDIPEKKEEHPQMPPGGMGGMM